MKKLLLILIMAMAAISCSDDDPVIPEPEAIKPTLVSKITVLREGAPEDVFHFTYDAKHRMQKITYDEGINTVEMSYNDADLVNRMVLTAIRIRSIFFTTTRTFRWLIKTATVLYCRLIIMPKRIFTLLAQAVTY